MCWFTFEKVRKYFFESKDKKTYEYEASILEDKQVNFLSNVENSSISQEEDQFEIL